MPLMLHSTSTRGRPPSSASGTSSNLCPQIQNNWSTKAFDRHLSYCNTTSCLLVACPAPVVV